MNYKKIYDNIIEKAKSENRVKGEGVYYEAHHIVPRCLGGKGTVNQWRTHPNIVLLTAKEHYVCHKLLCEIYPENYGLLTAFSNFVFGRHKSNQGGELGYKISSREYEIVRSRYSKNVSKFFKSVHRNDEWCYNISKSQKGKKGHPHSEQWKIEHSKRVSGKNHPFYGKNHTKEARKKMSEKKKGLYRGWNNPNTGVYMDIVNGIFYDINEIMWLMNNKSKGHLCAMMNGTRKNNTNFIKV